jgi:hypothetical protein
MLDRMLRVYLHPDSSPRILPKLHQAMGTLSTYVEQILERHANIAGAETRGLRLLEQILSDADLAAIRRYKDDFDRYLNILLPQQEDSVRQFDPAIQGITHFGDFTKTDPHGREYLLPIAQTDYIRSILVNGDWEAWAKIRPLHLLYSDSSDLSLNAYLDMLRYPKHPPFHVVVGIDATLLILQYAKYLDTHGLDDRKPIQDYLHKFVLYPALVEDSVVTWLVNQYTNILQLAADGLEMPSFEPILTPMMGSFGSQFPAAIEEVWNLIQDAKNANISPTRLLTSLQLRNTSLSYCFQQLRQKIELPHLRQYMWMQYLATLGWRNLVFATIALTKTHPITKSAMIWIKRDLHLLQATKFWAQVSDPITKHYIENDIAEKLDILA